MNQLKFPPVAPALMGAIVVALAATVAMYLLSPTPQHTAGEESGDPVDDATYLELQELMLKTPFSQPEVIEDSLRSYDIDGDGDDDVIGFLNLTFSPDSSVYKLATWHRDGGAYIYYDDAYYDYRFSGDTSCTIDRLALKSVTLACFASERGYLTTLRYQDSGGGYYRDVDAHAVTFHSEDGWREYVSKKGGIQFSYPPDVNISEKTYDVFGELITVIVAVSDTKTLFEIHSVPFAGEEGGGVIDIDSDKVFIKLADGHYLSRDRAMPRSERNGTTYDKTIVHRYNNVGSIFDSFERIDEKNRKYILYAPHTSESVLKEIDNIFASIKYLDAPATRDRDTISLKVNPISLASAATLSISGNITEKPAPANTSNALVLRDMELTYIDSLVYQPANLKLGLYSFGSIGGTPKLGGGGYDAEKAACYSYDEDKVTAPEKVGENDVCRFGWGDGGYAVHGYYVLDPNRKYIVSITENIESSALFESALSPDVKAIAESVRFSNL